VVLGRLRRGRFYRRWPLRWGQLRSPCATTPDWRLHPQASVAQAR
jgi:hypothetical protein